MICKIRLQYLPRDFSIIFLITAVIGSILSLSPIFIPQATSLYTLNSCSAIARQFDRSLLVGVVICLHSIASSASSILFHKKNSLSFASIKDISHVNIIRVIIIFALIAPNIFMMSSSEKSNFASVIIFITHAQFVVLFLCACWYIVNLDQNIWKTKEIKLCILCTVIAIVIYSYSYVVDDFVGFSLVLICCILFLVAIICFINMAGKCKYSFNLFWKRDKTGNAAVQYVNILIIFVNFYLLSIFLAAFASLFSIDIGRLYVYIINVNSIFVFLLQFLESSKTFETATRLQVSKHCV